MTTDRKEVLHEKGSTCSNTVHLPRIQTPSLRFCLSHPQKPLCCQKALGQPEGQSHTRQRSNPLHRQHGWNGHWYLLWGSTGKKPTPAWTRYKTNKLRDKGRRWQGNSITNLFQKAGEPTLPLLSDACQQNLFGHLIQSRERTNAQLRRSLNPSYLLASTSKRHVFYIQIVHFLLTDSLFPDTFSCAKSYPKREGNKTKFPKELRRLRHSNF